MMRLDMEYVEWRSFLLAPRALALTVPEVQSGEGAAG